MFFADFYGCLKSGKVSVLIRNCVFLTTKRESRDPIYASSSSCLPSYVWHCRTIVAGCVGVGMGHTEILIVVIVCPNKRNNNEERRHRYSR